MIIPDELAQKIVNIAHALTQQNVNIMGKDAVIIGTAQKHRYKTFHKGAQDVIATGEPVEIYPHEIELYPGSLPGLNLPIILEGQIIGVVGVSGDPNDVRKYARLVKKITELILERELFQEEVRSRLRLKEQLIELLLWRNNQENLSRIKRIANTLAIDLSAPRAVVAVDISKLIESSYSEYGESELVFERFSESIIQHLLTHNFISNQDIAAVIDKKLIIIKELGISSVNGALQKWANTLQSSFNNWQKGAISCAVGGISNNINEYQFSFKQAEFCLKSCCETRPYCTIYDSDLRSRYLLYTTSLHPESMIFQPLMDSFKKAFARKSEYIETLRAVLENNLEMKSTAYALGIHRNTLLYRLTCIKEATNLDPVRRLDDAITAKVLVSMMAST